MIELTTTRTQCLSKQPENNTYKTFNYFSFLNNLNDLMNLTPSRSGIFEPNFQALEAISPVSSISHTALQGRA